MKIDRNLVLVFVVAFGIGFCWSITTASNPSHDRPVMRWIARTARSLLWLAAFAEPAPKAERQYIVRSHIGADGFATVDHGRGW